MICEKCGAAMNDGASFCPKCGAKQTVRPAAEGNRIMGGADAADIAAQNVLVHSIWPDWEITDKIGEGSFGKVYRAKRDDLGSTVYSAVKIIKVPQNQSEAEFARSEIGLDDQSTTAYFKSIVDDCVNEIKTMESLKGTQNIVSIEDYKVIEDQVNFGWTIIIRMELLTSFVSFTKNRILNEQEVVKLGIDICNALEFCGKLNIMHRDIKPENIFISPFGIYKLGDFGIARKLERSSSGMSKKGTYNYMAPEIYCGSTSYDITSDIYSLGIMLYKLINNNRLPLVDPKSTSVTHQQMQEAFDLRQSGAPLPKPVNASDAFASVILTACAYDPRNRFPNATVMKQALLDVQNGRPVQFRPAPPQPNPGVDPDGTVIGVNSFDANATRFGSKANPPAKGFNPNPPQVPPAETLVPPKAPKKEKKKMSKAKKTLIVILVFLILGAAGTGAIMLSHYFSSEQKIVRALEKKDYDGALAVYNENYDDDAGKALINTLETRLNQIKDQYYNNEIEYEVANMEVSTIEKMNIADIADTLSSVKDDLAAMNASRTAFNTAQTMFEKADYPGAIENYKKVIEEDSNYETAKSQLSAAVENYRKTELEAAAAFVKDGSYAKAIAELENALKILPDDASLTEQITVYQSENSAHLKEDAIKTAAEYAEKEDYESAIGAIRSAMKDNDADAELTVLMKEYSEKYVAAVTAKVDELTAARNYGEAIAALEAALKVLPDNTALKEKLDTVKANQPALLSSLTPINGGWEWNEGTPTDPFENTYTNAVNYVIFSGNANSAGKEYYAEYRLYGKYKSISGELVPHTDIPEMGTSQISVYADDKLVYTSSAIGRKTDLIPFTADIAGADYVKIVVNCKDALSNGEDDNCLILMNVQLWTE